MSVVAYQCASCGGELSFNAAHGKFICEYCGSEYEEAELDKKDAKPSEEPAPSADDTGAQMYHCPNCGGDVITDDTTAATLCYYCHSPVVLTGRLGGDYLPKRIIPFQFAREVAVDKFYEWTKSKWFLPKDFFSTKQIENLTGVYFPYWIIDADADVQYTVSGEKCRHWTSGDTDYTLHRVFHCERAGSVHLEDIVKAALSKQTKTLVESIQPFDEKDLIPFNMAYLSGFQAERRDIEQAQIEAEVRNDIEYYCKKTAEATVSGYTSVNELGYHCQPTHIDWEYGLLPVWTLNYQYKGENYYFAMNGQSGKMVGKLPVDQGKLMLVSILGGMGAMIFSNIIFALVGG